MVQFRSVQFSRSVMSDSLWPHESQHTRPPSLSIPNSQSSLRLTSIESVMPSSHLIFCRPLLLLPSIFPRISVFWNGSVLCIRWPKYWSFSFNISSSSEHSSLNVCSEHSGDWKSWLKAQHSENEDPGIWPHHFTGNRWENNGNSVRLYLFGLQNHCRWWLQPWN